MSHLRIDSPCHEDWSRMTPTERGRFCAKCRKEVVDLTQASASTGRRQMADLRERLTKQANAHVCVHGETDGRGRILTPARRRLLTNAFAGMFAMVVAGCAGSGPEVGDASSAKRHAETASHDSTPMQRKAAEGERPLAVDGDVEVIEPPRRVLHAAGGICAPPPPQAKPKSTEPTAPNGNG